MRSMWEMTKIRAKILRVGQKVKIFSKIQTRFFDKVERFSTKRNITKSYFLVIKSIDRKIFMWESFENFKVNLYTVVCNIIACDLVKMKERLSFNIYPS
jgi:hypothetical protein